MSYIWPCNLFDDKAGPVKGLTLLNKLWHIYFVPIHARRCLDSVTRCHHTCVLQLGHDLHSYALVKQRTRNTLMSCNDMGYLMAAIQVPTRRVCMYRGE
jgi:hypothetical protein